LLCLLTVIYFVSIMSCIVLYFACCSNVVLVVVFFLVAIYGVESILCYLVWKWCWWSFGTTMKASVWSVWMWHAKVWGIYRGVSFRTVRLLKLSLLITGVCIVFYRVVWYFHYMSLVMFCFACLGVFSLWSGTVS
jgi:hypothetical protein